MSYITAIFWIIITYKYKEFDYDSSEESFYTNHFKENEDSSIVIGLQDQYDRAVIIFYYIVTTNSTVGFGDFVPISDTERLLCVAIMYFG